MGRPRIDGSMGRLSRSFRVLLTGAAVLLAACSPSRDASPPLVTPTPAENPRPLVRVLGTAQDGGFPHAACRCGHCESARRSPGAARLVASLALLLPDGRVFLIDATPDIRPQLDRIADARAEISDRVDRSPVDGVFLTHAHIGHYTGLMFFGFEAIHTRDMKVWGTPAMVRFLETNAPWDQLVRIGNIRPVAIAQDGGVELSGEVRVEALRVPHRDEYADTVAFVIQGPRRSVLYVPDTDTWRLWDPPLSERIAGIDVALLDGTFYSMDELPGRDVSQIRHPLIEETMDLLQEPVDAGRIEVYFTHLNHSNPALIVDGEARREIERRGFHVAEDGAEFALGVVRR